MSNIQIQDVDQRVQYTATASQTVFTVPFPFLANSDIVVYQNSTKLDEGASAGEYGLSGAGNPSGGTMTLVTGATVNDIITIFGNQPIDRTSIYSATISNLTGSDLNNDFNREIIMLKQLWTTQNLLQLQYAPYAEVSQDETVTTDRWLPKMSALESWRMNAGGTAIEVYQGLDVTAASGLTFLVQTADSTIPNAQAMGALATGIVKNTTSTGVQSISLPLTSIDSLTIADQKMLVGTGADTYALADMTTYSQTLNANATLGAWQAQLGIPGGGTGVYLPLAGGTMTGAIAMGTNKITGMGDPSDPQDAATKAYSDLKLLLTGGTLSGTLDMSANKILDVGTPTLGGDAVNKTYVDNLIQNIHVACDLGATADIGSFTYDNGTAGVGATLTATGVGVLTIDGVATVLGDRLLLKDQTAPAENGIWDVTTEGTAGVAAILTRATDYDEAGDMQAGDMFAVVKGSTQAATEWMMSQTAAITVGTTSITFAQVSGQGALLVANNLSDLASASTARTNLGVEIGVDVQAYDAGLLSIAGLTTAANTMIYTTALDTYAVIAASNSSVLVTSAGGVPSLSSSLPSGLTIPGFAASGANADITSMTGLTGVLEGPTGINDTNSNEVLTFTAVGSAVNYLDISNNSIGLNPLIEAKGDDANVGISYQAKGTGAHQFLGTADQGAVLRLYEDTDNGTNYVGLQAPATLAASQDYTLPSADAAVANAALVSDAAGVLSFLTKPTITQIVVQTFTASGTYTPTAGMAYCISECVGGGAGGGGTADSSGNSHGGGGGAGGYSRKISTAADIGASQTVTIGAGGSGGATGANSGSGGGDTSVGAICIAKGGSGGAGAAANSQAQGGLGGVLGTGDFTAVGGVGGVGSGGTITTAIMQSGGGGRSFYGGGTLETQYTVAATDAVAYGDGGSGAESRVSNGADSGGDGFAGVVFITEFLSV